MRDVDVINQHEHLFSPMTLIARVRDAVVLCLRKVIAEVINDLALCIESCCWHV